MEQDGPAKKPGNWYGGWRLLAMATVTVLSAKLIGILGTFVAGILFLWLQPKRGTGKAFAMAAIVGVLIAVVYSAALLPALYEQQAAPSQQPPEQIDWEKGVYTPPPAAR